MFGVLVANTSLTSSAGALDAQVIGSARVQLTARSPAGFDQRLAGTVERLPGVRSSAAVLRENVSVVGPRGAEPVQLLGVSAANRQRSAVSTRKNFGSGGFRFSGGLVLPASVASAIGAEPGSRVTVLAAGGARAVRVGAVLGEARCSEL